MTVKTSVTRIGNSRGVRIPKAMLDAMHMDGPVELEAKNGHIIIRKAKHPREGWAEAFRKLKGKKEPDLDDWKSMGPTEFEKTEWEW